MKLFLRIACLIGLLPVVFFGDEPSGGSKLGGYRYFIGYHAVEPKSLDEIPADVRAKVIEHLKDRLGEEFFAQLKFVGGQIVDVDALVRTSPRYQGRLAEVYTYDLHFRFERPEIGIIASEPQIKLRADRSVLEEINLPAFHAHPEKLKLLSFAEVKRIAAKSEFVGALRDANLDYSPTLDSIFWRLSRTLSDDGLGGQIANIEISAHDGAVLRTFESNFIR